MQGFVKTDMEDIKYAGIAAAYKAAEVLRSWYGHLDGVEKKGEIDLVTKADIQAEAVIIETIKAQHPDHSILAEESGRQDRDTGKVWIIDPLDGTTNFSHSIPWFATSIAYAENDEILAGFVLNPINGEFYTAVKGEGAFLNGRFIRVTDTADIKDSLLVTGFPYDIKNCSEQIIKRVENSLKSSQGLRRFGSASLDLCCVACGRYEGFFEENLKPWDTAAGVLIAKEAGAKISVYSGEKYDIYKKEILVTNGKIHDAMISLMGI